MFWLRKTTPVEPLILSMTGLRPGERVLFVGCSAPKVVAQLAVRPGLTGHAVAVDDDAGRTSRVADAAQHEGALLEVETAPLEALPFNPGSFDVVILPHLLGHLDEGRRRAVLEECVRVLRAGGRSVAIETGSSGMRGLFGRGISARQIEALFEAAGLRGARTLADRSGLAFVEGGKRELTRVNAE